MECNKDEAIRAKELAEIKMKNSDFEGAKKVILKAQNLYPELENISQLLSICDVHCSAKKSMLGSEKDWYGVLQVEKFADEMAIKKQYRRLALFLHPDKNRFPGAEAAFKLICEANAVLSDRQKKCLYDAKIKVMARSATVVPPPHHINKASHFNKQYGAEVKASNGFHSMNQYQATRSSFSVRKEVFCTSCPFCCLKYQLDRKFVNTTVRCQKCSKSFTGMEMSAQGVPLASKCAPESSQKVPVSMSQYSGFHENGIPNQGGNKAGVQNGKGFPASHLGSQRCANKPTVPPGSGVRMESIFKDTGVGLAAKVSGDLNLKRKGYGINSEHGGKESETYNGYPNKREDRNRRNKKKGRRKGSEESSESYETSSESDPEDVIVENYSAPTNLGNPRRSSRQRQNVSYKEGNDDDDDDDDLPTSHNRSQGNKLSEENGNRKSDGESAKHENQNGLPTYDCSESESKETGPVHPEESSQDKDLDCDSKSNIGTDAVEIETDSDIDASDDSSDEEMYQFEDPEFNDFDKDRDASCFAVNQYWACYDSVDGMPRFYAKVKRVRLSPFELCIAWLEADPADDPHKKWLDEGLPVGCGNFKVGETQNMSSCDTFAQEVHCEKGKRGSLILHPRRGEVWALFKDWDLTWSTQPQRHRKFKYEVVEVLSDFDAVAGIRVCYLDKVGGFVSLFQRSSQSATESFMIRPNELYRFSHCIRCFKMKGTEREGVPAGSFELDPSSLPANPDNLFYPSKAKAGTDNMEPEVNCAPKSGVGKDNFVDLESSDE